MSSEADNLTPEITCISGGPLIQIPRDGRVFVRPVGPKEAATPMVAAFIKDTSCAQMKLAFPCEGFTRDYRKASLEAVCKALLAEDKPFEL